jgi:hypothetical protein
MTSETFEETIRRCRNRFIERKLVTEGGGGDDDDDDGLSRY